MTADPDYHPESLFAAGCEIASILYRTLERLGYDSNELEDINAVHQQINDFYSIEQIIDYIVSLLHRFHDCYSAGTRLNHKVVTQAKDYIARHYNETVTLKDLAKLTNMNASYLSNLFKKEMGMNYSDYIADLRISIAKRLLKDGCYSVQQISEKVGYKDEKYFRKLFKKVSGISIGEFKKLYN